MRIYLNFNDVYFCFACRSACHSHAPSEECILQNMLARALSDNSPVWTNLWIEYPRIIRRINRMWANDLKTECSHRWAKLGSVFVWRTIMNIEGYLNCRTVEHSTVFHSLHCCLIGDDIALKKTQFDRNAAGPNEVPWKIHAQIFHAQRQEKCARSVEAENHAVTAATV